MERLPVGFGRASGVERRQQRRAGSLGHGPRLIDARGGGDKVQIARQRAADGFVELRIVERLPPGTGGGLGADHRRRGSHQEQGERGSPQIAETHETSP
jgi:hypothetical protein